jgi:hypothetical protein
MKIDIPYEVGDKVYVIKYVDKHWIKCPTCKGHGTHGEDEYGSDRSCDTCDRRSGWWYESVQPYWKVYDEQLEVGGFSTSCNHNVKLRLGTRGVSICKGMWFNYDNGSLFVDGLVSLEYIFKTKKQAETAAKKATKKLRDAENILRSKGR